MVQRIVRNVGLARFDRGDVAANALCGHPHDVHDVSMLCCGRGTRDGRLDALGTPTGMVPRTGAGRGGLYGTYNFSEAGVGPTR